MKLTHHNGDDNPLEGLKILLPGVPVRSNRGWMGYCSVVLFPLNGEWGLFDTGHYSDRFLLMEAFKTLQIELDAIRWVVLSHLHFDHVLNLSLFKNATVFLARAELEYAEKVLEGSVEDPSIPEIWPELLRNRDVQLIDRMVKLDHGVELVNFPGHTPGCLAMFYERLKTVAVCGDVIKNAWEAETGVPGYPGVATQQTRNNVKQIKERSDIIIPGHDRPFQICSGGVDYLTDLNWQVTGSFFPGNQNEVLINLDLEKGYYPKQ